MGALDLLGHRAGNSTVRRLTAKNGASLNLVSTAAMMCILWPTILTSALQLHTTY